MKIVLFCMHFALLLACAGCAMMIDHENQRYLPRRPNWKLKTELPDPDHLIRYDCIYVKVVNDQYFPKYLIHRFWPTGQYMSKYLEDYTATNDYNSFNGASVGYYRVEGMSLLKESFGPLNFGQYGYSVSTIQNNGSFITESHGMSIRRQRKLIPPFVFTPVEVEMRELNPDW